MANRQIHLLASEIEFLCDLGTRLDAAHNQRRTGYELLRVAVGVGVDLSYRWRQCRTEARHFGRLIKSSCDHDIPDRKVAAVPNVDQVQPRCFVPLHPLDAHVVANRQMEPLNVGLEIGDDVVARHEAVGVRTFVLGARQPRLPVWRIERERIPAVIAPCFWRLARLLHDQMIATLPCQVVAHRKPGLPSTNDDSVDLDVHGILLSKLGRRGVRVPTRVSVLALAGYGYRLLIGRCTLAWGAACRPAPQCAMLQSQRNACFACDASCASLRLVISMRLYRAAPAIPMVTSCLFD